MVVVVVGSMENVMVRMLVEASAEALGKIVRVLHERGPVSSLCKSKAEAVETKAKDFVGVHAGNCYLIIPDGFKTKPERRDLREVTEN